LKVLAVIFGYLDPGSGSMIVQILAGGVAALAVALKLFWRRVLHVLHIRRMQDYPPETEPGS
jgi:hypothetical protein